jgi:AhpC/TSA family
VIRFALRVLFALVIVYVAITAGLAVAMRQTPDKFGAIMAKVPPVAFAVLPFETLWMKARAGHLEVGDAAPDFTLKTLDGAKQVQLSSFRGQKPVVLVFGSYT